MEEEIENSPISQKVVVAAASSTATPPPLPSNTDVDTMLTGLIGTLERYQILCVILLYLSKFPVGWNQLSITILAPNQNFSCADEANPTVFDNTCVEGCKKYVFDQSVFHSTIVSDFNLICERFFLTGLTQSFFMLGILVGAIAFGNWSDKKGRRMPIIAAVILQMFTGVLAAFSPDWYSFTVMRFFLGAATGGSMTVSFVLILEVVGSKYREVMSILYQIPFSLGHISVAGFGYFFRDWHDSQLAMAVPTVIYLSFICLLTESPRWLISRGKVDEAVKVVTKAAKMNKRPTENVAPLVTAAAERNAGAKRTKTSITLLFADKRIRFRNFASCFIWFSASFGYFGISHHVSGIGGDIFSNIAISGSFGGVGNIASYFLNYKFGRRLTLIMVNIVAAACCIILGVLTKRILVVDVLLCSVGLAAMFSSFTTAYVYTGELFPTTLRNNAVGISSASARIGSMISPFVATMHVEWMAAVIFGTVPLIAAFVVYFLPETKWQPLPETLDDMK